MLTCSELIEFLDRYLAGELPLRRRLAFKMHLALCRECRAYLDSYRKTVFLARQAFRQDAPEPALPEPPEALIEAVLKAAGDPPRGP